MSFIYSPNPTLSYFVSGGVEDFEPEFFVAFEKDGIRYRYGVAVLPGGRIWIRGKPPLPEDRVCIESLIKESVIERRELIRAFEEAEEEGFDLDWWAERFAEAF